MGVVLFFIFLCKHAIADIAIQSIRPPCDKSWFFNKGLQLHALDHSLLTLAILLFVVNPVTAFALAFFDYIAHVTIDWAKTNLLKQFGIPRHGPIYWNIQSLDQIMHYATYMAIVMYVVNHT